MFSVAFSFTFTSTGFRSPALIKSSTCLVCVAEKRPVRLCLGKYFKMTSSDDLKPKSNKRSASSKTRNSRFLMDAVKFKSCCFLVNRSSSRPGVQIKMLPPFSRRVFKSSSICLPPTKRI